MYFSASQRHQIHGKRQNTRMQNGSPLYLGKTRMHGRRTLQTIFRVQETQNSRFRKDVFFSSFFSVAGTMLNACLCIYTGMTAVFCFILYENRLFSVRHGDGTQKNGLFCIDIYIFLLSFCVQPTYISFCFCARCCHGRRKRGVCSRPGL